MGCQCDNRLAFVLGMTLATAGGVLVSIFGSMYIPPYLYDSTFEQVTCTVEQSHFSGNFCCDYFYPGSMSACSLVVPCPQVVVNYQLPGGASNVSAIFYDGYVSATYQAPNFNCSYYKCPATYEEARLGGLSLFASKGQVGQTYTCYRNPARVTEVLPTRTDLSAVVVSMLIPFIIMVLGLVFGYLGYYGSLPHCQTYWDEEDAEENDVKTPVSDPSGLDVGDKAAGAPGTDEGATDDTHLEEMSLSSQTKLNKSGGKVDLGEGGNAKVSVA